MEASLISFKHEIYSVIDVVEKCLAYFTSRSENGLMIKLRNMNSCLECFAFTAQIYIGCSEEYKKNYTAYTARDMQDILEIARQVKAYVICVLEDKKKDDFYPYYRIVRENLSNKLDELSRDFYPMFDRCQRRTMKYFHEIRLIKDPNPCYEWVEPTGLEGVMNCRHCVDTKPLQQKITDFYKDLDWVKFSGLNPDYPGETDYRNHYQDYSKEGNLAYNKTINSGYLHDSNPIVSDASFYKKPWISEYLDNYQVNPCHLYTDRLKNVFTEEVVDSYLPDDNVMARKNCKYDKM